MENKIKKEKEYIKSLIQKEVECFYEKKGILFFDKSTSSLRDVSYFIEDSEIEVLMIKLNKSKKIILTTKHLYIIGKSGIKKMNSNEIESYEYLPEYYSRFPSEISIFRRIYYNFQWRLHLGDFRILKKDETFIDLFIPSRNRLYCLTTSIDKLKFVTEKYEGI